MKIHSRILKFLLFALIFSAVSTYAQQKTKDQKIEFITNVKEKIVDVMIDGQLFTSYIWPISVMKPVLYPVITASGTEITRGFPLQPRPGERVDHPHHVGIWFNYGDVNGLDFWNNSEAIPADKKSGYGTIRQDKIVSAKNGKGEGILEIAASWLDPEGNKLLAEKTKFSFIAKGSTRIIDRITTLTAENKDVSLKDNKEGVFAIRVARQLELPTNEEVVLTDSKGIATTVKAMNNDGVTGSYLSREGIKDDAVWGTRAKWMQLTGTMNNEKVSIVICDHKKNIGYPTYWHARGYGLFAANPLGWSIFTKDKEQLNFVLKANQSVVFRYRMIIDSGEVPNSSAIDELTNDFNEKY